MIIQRGTVVEHEGKRGVVVDDFMSCCGAGETPVVYYGDSGFTGTPTAELQIIGPENPIADPQKCGAGDKRCCIFLTLGVTGWNCERHGTLRYALIFAKSRMNASRHPVAKFPYCQSEES
jgi:hypothetical protein